jgi:hypothetical protein
MAAEHTGHEHEHERHYERAADPAEAADRPLEPRSSGEELHETDTPIEAVEGEGGQDPHHSLNTPVGDVDPTADSDPYRAETPEDDADRASGVRGEGQGSDDR